MTAELWSQFLTQTAFPVIEAIALIAVNVLIVYLAKKFRIEGILKHRESMEKITLDAISYAEEKAEEFVKIRGQDNEGRNRLNSADKMNLAISRVMDSIPRISREDARNYIENMIGQVEGVGSTGKTAIKKSGG